MNFIMTMWNDGYIVLSTLGSDSSVVNSYMILDTAKYCSGGTENIFIRTKEIKTHILLSNSGSRWSIMSILKMILINHVISTLSIEYFHD